MSLPKLYQTGYSPWSERARWALDHHGLAYRKIEYTPMLDEPLLRLRLGRWQGALSIPVLLAGDERLLDSVDIARWAEARGAGEKLFPAQWDRQVVRWIGRSNDFLEAGRSLLIPRMLSDRAARRETIPASIPALLRGVLDPLARLGTLYVQRKYRDLESAPDRAEATMRGVLSEVRARLAEGPWLVEGGFTFADVAIASAMQYVRPVEHPAMKVGPATRAAWTTAGLAGEFADVLAWRDRVYAARRPRSAAVKAKAKAKSDVEQAA